MDTSKQPVVYSSHVHQLIPLVVEFWRTGGFLKNSTHAETVLPFLLWSFWFFTCHSAPGPLYCHSARGLPSAATPCAVLAAATTSITLFHGSTAATFSCCNRCHDFAGPALRVVCHHCYGCCFNAPDSATFPQHMLLPHVALPLLLLPLNSLVAFITAFL